MEQKGKKHFDRLCVTSCRASRQKRTLRLFPCLHNSFVRDKLETSLPLPAQLEERQNNNSPENICLRRLEGRNNTDGHVSLLASTGGGGHMPAWSPSVGAPGPLPFLGSRRLSLACRPTCLSDCLSAFSLANGGSAVTDEGPACQSSWLLGCIRLVLR